MRILAIGNSFSSDATDYLYEIVKSANKETDIYVGNLFYGGCTLSQHLQFFKEESAVYEYMTSCGSGWQTKLSATVFDALSDGEWDIISFQQASGFSGKAESYDSLYELAALVREKVGGKPKFVWHMTWAYATASDHPHFEWYGKEQKNMYASILQSVKEKILPFTEIKAIAPSGVSVQLARNTGLNGVGNELTRDGFHLDLGVGRYLAGLTLAKFFLGVDLDAVTFKPDGITDQMAEEARACAKRAEQEFNSKI